MGGSRPGGSYAADAHLDPFPSIRISQMTRERGANPKDIVKEGQLVKVKLMGFDDRGKVRLSLKVVDQETGLEIKRESEGA